jgi:hypothetical protein
MLLWFLTLTLLPAAPAGAQASKENSNSARPRGETYRDDPCFRKPVTFPVRHATAGEVVQELSLATGAVLVQPTWDEAAEPDTSEIGLAVQGNLHHLPVLAACRAVPAAELMEALELATAAKWRRTGRVWVLTDTPGLEDLAVLPGKVRSKRESEATAPLKTLTPEQAQLLMARKTLLPEDLTPVQRQALLAAAQYNYLSSGGDIAPEALQLQGVYLKLEGPPENKPEAAPDLGIVFPMTDRLNNGIPWISIPIENIRVAPAPIGANPRLAPPSPRLPEPAPLGGRPRGDARYREDPVLAVPVRLTKPSVLTGAHRVASSTGANLVVSTEFESRLLFENARELPAWEILQAIEQATGGAWRVLGSTYVLQTDPTLERLALDKAAQETDPDLERLARSRTSAQQQQWLVIAAASVQQGIDRRQKEILRERGRLLPGQITQKQKDSLKWVAYIAFASQPDIAVEALDLKGVQLKYHVPDPKPSVPRQVQFVLPTRSRESRVIATLPLR